MWKPSEAARSWAPGGRRLLPPLRFPLRAAEMHPSPDARRGHLGEQVVSGGVSAHMPWATGQAGVLDD